MRKQSWLLLKTTDDSVRGELIDLASRLGVINDRPTVEGAPLVFVFSSIKSRKAFQDSLIHYLPAYNLKVNSKFTPYSQDALLSIEEG